MSLLLDALKKAAQEKQNASSAEKNAESDIALSLKQELESERPVVEEEQLNLEQPAELELDDDALSLLDESKDYEAEKPAKSSDINYQENRVTPTHSTVTDDALQLLIHKTNAEYKKSRLITWSGIGIVSLLLLSIGGVYFYIDMIEEIESMQRKHQIALATLKSKTRIEENLTSLAEVPDSNKQEKNAKEQLGKTDMPVNKSENNVSKNNVTQQSKNDYSVQRAEKRDPVSEALQRGWIAYQGQDYELSKREYKKVLDEEPGNHDALLGMAAVSLQQENLEAARDIYIKLLERDPRDPHAHAGLANIVQTSGADISETKLKQLIEYRPDDSHLQFALGNLYVQKNSWPEAQAAFFNAWRRDSNNPDYAYNLAVSLDHLGKRKEAKAYYEDSLKLAAGKNISFSPEDVRSRIASLGDIQ